MIGILAGTLVGIGLGLVSGLLPGVHANTLAAALLTFQVALLPVFGPEALAAAMFAALITHAFVDAIPSTFLGVPDADTALSVLPAHNLCLEGKGEEAVRIAALGSTAGVLVAIPLTLAVLAIAPMVQGYLDWWVGILLVGVIGYLVVTAESPFWNLVVFLTSGMLGIFTFHFSFIGSGVFGSSGLLMPLLSGLFGLSLLLTAGRGTLPPQEFSSLDLSRRDIVRGSIAGSIAGIVVGWLPGLSNATANVVLTPLVNYEKDRRGYIFATSAANTVNAMIGLGIFFALARSRNGVMAALSALKFPAFGDLLVCGILAAAVAYPVTILLSGSAHRLAGMDKTHVNAAVIILVSALSILTSGIFGGFILVLAITIGLLPRLLNIPQVCAIGAITLPVILYSFGIPF